MGTRGFVTIATGNEKYYKLAENLLCSYRIYCTDGTPFTIICDRENEYTKGFDSAVLLKNFSGSYMDKLLLYRSSPYDETIFVDADSLVLADPKGLWEDFTDADDVSCYGCRYPLDSDRAWFTYEGCGKYKKKIQYLIDLHGGIYFFRKGERCQSIFEKAIELAEEYHLYGFRHFEKPADEPVMAMSLAVHNSSPCDKPARVLFVPSYWGRLRATLSGKLCLDGKEKNPEILHFGTQNTERFLYRYIMDTIRKKQQNRGYQILRYTQLRIKTMPIEIITHIRHSVGCLLRKILPNTAVNALKKMI